MQLVAPEKNRSLSWGSEQLNVHRLGGWRGSRGGGKQGSCRDPQHPKHPPASIHPLPQKEENRSRTEEAYMTSLVFLIDSHRPWVKVMSLKTLRAKWYQPGRGRSQAEKEIWWFVRLISRHQLTYNIGLAGWRLPLGGPE